MLTQAITMGMMSSWVTSACLLPVKKLTNFLMCRCEPSVSRKRRISSWKRMMRASTPTLTNLSKMEPRSFISSTCDTTSQMRMNTKMPMNTLREPEAFISLYV